MGKWFLDFSFWTRGYRTAQTAHCAMVGGWPAHGKPYSYKTYAWRRASNHSAIRFCIILVSFYASWALFDNDPFQPRQQIYSPMRHGGKARTPEKSSPGTSVWTLTTSSPFFSQTPNFSTTFRCYLRFTFSQLEFPISKLIPSDRRNERRQTLFNAPGSIATNLKTSSEK